jgi:hypothetical protein
MKKNSKKNEYLRSAIIEAILDVDGVWDAVADHIGNHLGERGDLWAHVDLNGTKPVVRVNWGRYEPLLEVELGALFELRDEAEWVETPREMKRTLLNIKRIRRSLDQLERDLALIPNEDHKLEPD